VVETVSKSRRLANQRHEPLLLRAIAVMAIGFAIELAIPLSLAAFPVSNANLPFNGTGSSSSASQGCVPFTPSPSNAFCGYEVGIIILWNAIGVGVLIIGASWFLEWRRRVRPATAPVTAERAMWVRCTHCRLAVEWPTRECPSCGADLAQVYG
jgi:hypothetical protein